MRFAEWMLIGPDRGNQDDLFRILDAALNLLAQDERALIEARYFSSKSLEEMARAENTTIRAIEGRLARARDRLRQTIASMLRSSAV
jgi:RNA polymerase sigma factor (sigma-70 family)